MSNLLITITINSPPLTLICMAMQTIITLVSPVLNIYPGTWAYMYNSKFVSWLVEKSCHSIWDWCLFSELSEGFLSANQSPTGVISNIKGNEGKSITPCFLVWGKLISKIWLCGIVGNIDYFLWYPKPVLVLQLCRYYTLVSCQYYRDFSQSNWQSMSHFRAEWLDTCRS